MGGQMEVAVVLTVRDEATTVGALLEALAGQTRPPDETVLVDGGSTDGTLAVATDHLGRLPGLRLLEAPGTNIAAGRNRGIAATTCPLVAVTDAGCVPAPDWLERLTAPLLWDPAVLLVQGRAVPDPRGHLEACIGRCALAGRLRVAGVSFLPTARSLAFRRALWAVVGGFPEHLAFGEDAAFIVAAGRRGRIQLAPEAVVRWRPRRSYGEVVRQFYHYAEGAVAAGLSRQLHLGTLTRSLGGLAALGAGVATGHWLPWLALAGLGGAYLGRKAREGCFAVPSWRTYYRVPLVLLAIHLGTLAGLVHGHWRRLVTHAHPAG